jgi:hypothetical protein
MLFAESISFDDFPGFVPDGKAETSLRDVGNLRVRMAVHGSFRSFLEIVPHAHQLIAVGKNGTLHAGRGGFSGAVFAGYPLLVFMILFHIFITSLLHDFCQQEFHVLVVSVFLRFFLKGQRVFYKRHLFLQKRHLFLHKGQGIFYKRQELF